MQQIISLAVAQLMRIWLPSDKDVEAVSYL